MNLHIIAGMIGPQQIILIAVILLLLFGGKKIPELMKGVGTGIKEFKKVANENDDKDKEKDASSKEDKEPKEPTANK